MKHFPFFVYLQILQLEYYQPTKLLRWYLSHPLTFSLPQITPLKITLKVKLLLILSILQYFALSWLFLDSYFTSLVFILSLALFFFTPLPLLIAITLLAPFESIPKNLKIQKAKKLLAQVNPHTIGITGSFGKTTTKDFLFQILDAAFPTLKTTHSYNTPLGISQSILMGLTRHTKYFLAEFGAHYPGDIQKLSTLFPPQSAIITGIGPQHLERFRTIQNILDTKFELAKHIKTNHLLLNFDNQYIHKYLDSHPHFQSAHTYSLASPKATFFLSQFHFDQNGSVFTLNYHQQSFRFISPLFGSGNLLNLLAAISQSILLKIPIETIQKSVAVLAPAPHRLELVKINQATVVDNTYSSNFDGFNQIMSDLSNLKGTKALITPGLVELGLESDSLHQELGKKIADIFDEVILIGQSHRTQNITHGIKLVKPNAIIHVINRHDYWPTVRNLSTKFDWILLENDLPQNY
ncbi:MAG: UDP-N-acetylmuramoyl-tripeptide--D-alanyl-D-alanine ligase [Candidatus Shapirobacteria bacterium]|jgi:UDP-N-acetylmuramoyl-tripeptide--D-alanyl-D-alanine ligase